MATESSNGSVNRTWRRGWTPRTTLNPITCPPSATTTTTRGTGTHRYKHHSENPNSELLSPPCVFVLWKQQVKLNLIKSTWTHQWMSSRSVEVWVKWLRTRERPLLTTSNHPPFTSLYVPPVPFTSPHVPSGCSKSRILTAAHSSIYSGSRYGVQTDSDSKGVEVVVVVWGLYLWTEYLWFHTAGQIHSDLHVSLLLVFYRLINWKKKHEAISH